MEAQVLDPFGDYSTKGYLQNVYGVHDLEVMGRLETAAFQEQVLGTVRYLRRFRRPLQYSDVLETHRQLFDSLYPWAGEDRSVNAPQIAIVKGGHRDLFCHPADCERAANHALSMSRDHTYFATHPGEVFGYLAHAHPFLEGNGRTILTVFAELTRRAGFYIKWEDIEKQAFLENLTQELKRPGHGLMDTLVLPFTYKGVLSAEVTARRLHIRFGTRVVNEGESASR